MDVVADHSDRVWNKQSCARKGSTYQEEVLAGLWSGKRRAVTGREPERPATSHTPSSGRASLAVRGNRCVTFATDCYSSSTGGPV